MYSWSSPLLNITSGNSVAFWAPDLARVPRVHLLVLWIWCQCQHLCDLIFVVYLFQLDLCEVCCKRLSCTNNNICIAILSTNIVNVLACLNGKQFQWLWFALFILCPSGHPLPFRNVVPAICQPFIYSLPGFCLLCFSATCFGPTWDHSY